MSNNRQNKDSTKRLRLQIQGAVQGVGFRPFIFRLATSLKLKGWINNSAQGVTIEIEGPSALLADFPVRAEKEKPPRAFIHSMESSYLDPVGYTSFEIKESTQTGQLTALVLPDIATCKDCHDEVFDPNNRRYLYPFTNCTNCGPRFSIIEELPYDRPNTTMKIFEMCDECQAEYNDPENHRFHAQPNACPKCGPHLELWDRKGDVLNSHHHALLDSADAIRKGKIVAVKGLGGFHLMADATNRVTIQKLRKRKGREEKPFALMYPSLDLIRSYCEVSQQEERLLLLPESPIVLLKRKFKTSNPLAENIAPGNPYLGIMLPYTPLHQILMKEINSPVVATSGNISDEPICIDELEALERLGEIADIFLVHNRPIARHVDDSIVRIVLNREMVMRRARGYAPLPIHIKNKAPSILAVGAHLKNTIAMSVENQIFISQHIGDLETDAAFQAFQNVIQSFKKMYDCQPASIVCDAHPDYLSTQYANSQKIPVQKVQHHYAHVLACMLENDLGPPVLGVSWDGTGYGLDNTVWGGEFFHINNDHYQRVAHFKPFPLPGGELAIKEPRRSAIGLLCEMGEKIENSDLPPVSSFSEKELTVISTMIQKQINSPKTSSAGRLFDGVASLIGLRQINRFEGQAAMELEFQLNDTVNDDFYEFRIKNEKNIGNSSKYLVDWKTIVQQLLKDKENQIPISEISQKFHNTLTEIIVKIAKNVNESKVVLSGGCFQNRYLTEYTIKRLREESFSPYWHQRIPPNDGGISVGQIGSVILNRKFI